jgi:hypothetical protein
MTSATDELLPPGNDDLAIVFGHGFLDHRHTWDGVVNQLVTGVETIRVDLYGCGEQALPPGRSSTTGSRRRRGRWWTGWASRS